MPSLLIFPQLLLICSIWFDIFEHPVECNNCNNLFCQNCIKNFVKLENNLVKSNNKKMFHKINIQY